MKKLSEELDKMKGFKCCDQFGNGTELIALAKEWEDKVFTLENELVDAYADLTEIEDFDKEAFAKKYFYAGLKAFNNKKINDEYRSWLQFSAEDGL